MKDMNSPGSGLRRAALASGVIATVALLAAGCATSSGSLSYTPYTGIDIPSSIVRRRGCGTAPDQVFKYVVVLSTPSEGGPAEGGPAEGGPAEGGPAEGGPFEAGAAPLAPGGTPQLGLLPDGGAAAYASAFDCYTSGVFVSLTAAPNGSSTVGVWIYGYDRADFSVAASTVPAIDCGLATCPLSEADVANLLNTPATYLATCTAQPESGDHVQASCGPFDRTDEGTSADASSRADAVASADAATFADASSPSDATGGAETSNASGTASPADANGSGEASDSSAASSDGGASGTGADAPLE